MRRPRGTPGSSKSRPRRGNAESQPGAGSGGITERNGRMPPSPNERAHRTRLVRSCTFAGRDVPLQRSAGAPFRLADLPRAVPPWRLPVPLPACPATRRKLRRAGTDTPLRTVLPTRRPAWNRGSRKRRSRHWPATSPGATRGHALRARRPGAGLVPAERRASPLRRRLSTPPKDSASHSSTPRAATTAGRFSPRTSAVRRPPHVRSEASPSRNPPPRPRSPSRHGAGRPPRCLPIRLNRPRRPPTLSRWGRSDDSVHPPSHQAPTP